MRGRTRHGKATIKIGDVPTTPEKTGDEWSNCQLCGEQIRRDIYPVGRGSWWHASIGLDFKHEAVPTPRPVRTPWLAGVVGWIRHVWDRGFL